MKNDNTYGNSNTYLIISIITALCFSGLIILIGTLRGWQIDPITGVYSYYTIVDTKRFWDEPNINNTFDQSYPGRSGKFAAGTWYYWRLPPPNQTTLTRALPWVLYLSHQFSVWGTIFYAQNLRPEYRGSMRGFNIIALCINALFHLLHLGQTHWTYDSLAPEVSEASSQGAVILLLCAILVLEYPTRGIFFGWPTKDSKFYLPNSGSDGPIAHLRKYHGYYFSWAAVYTLWYHPMDATIGHAVGFCHTNLILIQGAMMFTTAHRNVYWRLLVEVWVLFHATAVSIQIQQGSLWRMFFFGFSLIFVMTQVFGIPFFKNSNNILIRLSPFIAWIAAVATTYGVSKDWGGLNEVIRIPAIEYGLMFEIWLLLQTYLFIRSKIPITLSDNLSKIIGGFLFIISYFAIILISSLVEVYKIQMDLLLLAVILIVIYSLFLPISQIGVEMLLGNNRRSSSAEIIKSPLVSVETSA